MSNRVGVRPNALDAASADLQSSDGAGADAGRSPAEDGGEALLTAPETCSNHSLFAARARGNFLSFLSTNYMTNGVLLNRGLELLAMPKNWHCFTLSRYDRNTGSWEMEKAPVFHIID